MTVNIHGTIFIFLFYIFLFYFYLFSTDPNKESLAMNLVNKNTVRILLKYLDLILFYILNMAYCFRTVKLL